MASLHLLSALGLVMIISAVTVPVRAEEVIAGSIYDQEKEHESVLKARRRAYVGGRDEGDLTVQTQLTAPTRKMTPQTEPGGETGGDE